MTPPDTITAAQFQALCALLWGDGWRPAAADALGVNLRNVQFWAAEPPARCKPVPPGVVRELLGLVASFVRAHPATANAAAHRLTAQAGILQLVIALENSQYLTGG